MPNIKLLNKQNAKTIDRISRIICILTLAGAAIIFFFVTPPPWSIPKVEAVVEQRPDNQLTYPPYSFFSNRRLDVFSYGSRNQGRPLIKKMPARAAHALPGPNATGLTLLATLPGKDHSYIVVKGLEGSGESLVNLGDKIRDSLLAKVDSDSIILTRNAQNTTLLLNTPWRTEADRLLKSSHIPVKESYATYAFSSMAATRTMDFEDAGLDIRDLGLFMVPLTKEEREELELGPDTGLRITKVVRDDLGAEPGDLLVAAAGKPVGKVEQIVELLQRDNAEDIHLTLIRNGKPINIRVSRT